MLDYQRQLAIELEKIQLEFVFAELVDAQLELEAEEQKNEEMAQAISLSHTLTLASFIEKLAATIREAQTHFPQLGDVANLVQSNIRRCQLVRLYLVERADKEMKQEAELAAIEDEQRRQELHDQAEEANLAKIIPVAPSVNIHFKKPVIEEPDDIPPPTTTASSPQNLSLPQEVVFTLRKEIEDVCAESRAVIAELRATTEDIKSSMASCLDFVKKGEEDKKKEEIARQAAEEARRAQEEEEKKGCSNQNFTGSGEETGRD